VVQITKVTIGSDRLVLDINGGFEVAVTGTATRRSAVVLPALPPWPPSRRAIPTPRAELT